MPIDAVAERYLREVLTRYSPPDQQRAAVVRVFQNLAPKLRGWAGAYLASLQLTGSFAKGTAISGESDVDVLVSLKHDTPGSLGDIYYNLVNFLKGYGFETELRNVSVRVRSSGLAVDLVPGRRQHALGFSQSLFSRRSGNWIKTNVEAHVRLIKDSNHRRQIRLLKIWRRLRELEFPSFYLELSVLEALRSRPTLLLSTGMLALLDYLSTEFTARRIVDPANSANVISEDLSIEEKSRIARAAAASLAAATWRDVIR